MTTPWITRPDLNPYNPANGNDPQGASTYSEEFKSKSFSPHRTRASSTDFGGCSEDRLWQPRPFPGR